MYPDDRVLIGVMPSPRDLELAREQHWYRVPVKHAPAGIHAEYVAFYFTRTFGPDLRWAIHYYARRTGHELVRRVDLLPDQPDHPRAQERYYRLQLGPLRQKVPPITSAQGRRITFIHTTWEQFMAAKEIGDLLATGNRLAEQVFRTLQAQGIPVQRDVVVCEHGQDYTVDLLIPCQNGDVLLSGKAHRPAQALLLHGHSPDLKAIRQAIQQHGGLPACVPPGES
jgi:hypothetical protein